MDSRLVTVLGNEKSTPISCGSMVEQSCKLVVELQLGQKQRAQLQVGGGLAIRFFRKKPVASRWTTCNWVSEISPVASRWRLATGLTEKSSCESMCNLQLG